jgi:4-hydroxythreonine-4-phosphate dehydrogenase
MGEPAGISGEITVKAWHAAKNSGNAFFVIDDPDRLAAVGEALGLDIPIAPIAGAEEAREMFPRALPVLPQPLARPVQPGRPDAANADAVLASIRRAVEAAMSGEAAAVVTNPIHKKALADAGFRHPGHTEFLGELTGAEKPVMMLACPGLRVVPVTVHAPLATAIGRLTTGDIVAAARITYAALQSDFAIATPRLAIAGLNPHAGEQGLLGDEERDIITPAVEQLRRDGLAVSGPAPADSLFHARARERYDAAICMYHDQALIPLKTVDFDNGVDITLGLPVVRTSPDHGTALDIAGRGVARELSLLAALDLARSMAGHRARASAEGRSGAGQRPALARN